MVVAGGPDGEVGIPAIYYGSHADADDAVKLSAVQPNAGAARRASPSAASWPAAVPHG